jgi:hypothetical protein
VARRVQVRDRRVTRGLLRCLHADGGFPGDGGSDVDVAIDLLQGKVRGWSVKMRKREGR